MRCVVPSGIVTQRESGGIIDSVKCWTTKLANCLDNQNGERYFYYMNTKFALAMLFISAYYALHSHRET